MSAYVDGNGHIRGASVEQRERWETELARRLARDLVGVLLDEGQPRALEILVQWHEDIRTEIRCGHPGAGQA